MLHSSVFQNAETVTNSPELTSLLRLINQNYVLNKQIMADISAELAEYVSLDKTEQYAFFVNKAHKLNILDIRTNTALYELDPVNECLQEFYDFCQTPPYFALTELAGCESKFTHADVLLLFGLGLGYVLQHIIEQLDVKFLIVYEPRTDIFTCSTFAVNWQYLLNIAEQRGIYLGLQVGSSGSNLAEHLNEIKKIKPDINRIYYYRHLAHPVSDEVIQYYRSHSGNSSLLLRTGQQFIGLEQAADYLPARTAEMLNNVIPNRFEKDSDVFNKNISAFKKYFPFVAKQFEKYTAVRWELMVDNKNQPNLYQFQRGSMLYRHFENDCKQVSEFFFRQAVSKRNHQLKQKVPYKLRNYIHYRALSKLQVIENKVEGYNENSLEQVSSLVIAGSSMSLPLMELLNRDNLKNIFIFEPEPDFFFASLFILPWHDFLIEMDKMGRQLYLNIGGSTTEYFDEILRQFYRVGAYALAETCFWLNYVTPQLQYAISSLQQQLRSVLALGDYFDHAKYGLHHTLININQGCYFMKDKKLEKELADLPIFIIGNGPSVDDVIEEIKQYQQRAIIVSCGTALKALISYGIVPDFHVEAEQNGSTFDHLKISGELSVLKNIRLISFSSIHPATKSLFKQSFLAFKEGEAPTVIFQKEIEKFTHKLSTLSYAFPTAANLALSFMLNLGHNKIYLFGVDFGQIDPTYHHSKKSIYYNKIGGESYSYQSKNPEEIIVPGNFVDSVYTKSEFDLARNFAEMLLKDYFSYVEVYNCSNGAKIRGAVSLLPENILLQYSLLDKASYYQALEKDYFVSSDSLKPLSTRYETGILTLTQKNQIIAWCNKLVLQASSVAEAKIFLSEQWHYFEYVLTAERVVFCLYYSSVSYFFSRLTALLNINDTNFSLSDKMSCFEDMLAIFKGFLVESVTSIKEYQHDQCSAELAFLRRM